MMRFDFEQLSTNRNHDDFCYYILYANDGPRPKPLDSNYPYIGLLVDSTFIEVYRPRGRFEEAKIYFDAKNGIYALKKKVAVSASPYACFIFSKSTSRQYTRLRYYQCYQCYQYYQYYQCYQCYQCYQYYQCYQCYQCYRCYQYYQCYLNYLLKTPEEKNLICTDAKEPSWAILGDRGYIGPDTDTSEE